MKCIILAAGYATRMYPLTLNFPKPLLEVGGRPILDWLRSDILACGIDQIFVVTNHKFYSQFVVWAQDKPEVTVLDDGTSTNETRLGALHDISYVLDNIASKGGVFEQDYLILAGDNVLDFSFKAFLDYAQAKNASCVMRHFQGDVERLRRTGVCEIAADDRILSMEEKPKEPKSNWAVPPFYFYKGEDLKLLSQAFEQGISADAPGSFVSYLATRRPVYAFPMTGHRYDVGTIEGYEKLKVSYKGLNLGA